MPVQTKQQVFHILSSHTDELQRLGVKQVGLFGSFVRDQQNDQSDVDVLVEFVPGQKTFDNFMQVALLLEEVLGRAVDLVTPESLSPYIGPRILREVEYGSLHS